MIPSLTKVFYLIHETFFYFFLIQFYASVKVKKGYVNRYDTFRLLKVSILTAISWPNFWSTVMQNYQNVSFYLKKSQKVLFFYNWFTKFLPLLKVSSCPWHDIDEYMAEKNSFFIYEWHSCKIPWYAVQNDCTEYRTIFSNLSRFFCFPFCFSG